MTLTPQEILEMPRDKALEYVEALQPADQKEELFKLHVTSVLHHQIGLDNDDQAHVHLALQAAEQGVELAWRNSLYPAVAGKMAVNYIVHAGMLEMDIRDKLPFLRHVVVSTGDTDLITHIWWRSNFQYFYHLRVLDTADACLIQYRRCEGHDPQLAEDHRKSLEEISGSGVSELTRLKSEAAWRQTQQLRDNERFVSGPGFKPTPPPDWRTEDPKGQEWFEFVTEKHVDALALTLDLLEQMGDPRLALAVQAMRECNEVLAQAAEPDEEQEEAE